MPSLPQPFGSSECCFAASTGESGGFMHFRGILILSGLLPCVTASVLTPGMSLCPLDLSVWPPRPSISTTSRFTPPAPRYVSALRTWMHQSFSRMLTHHLDLLLFSLVSILLPARTSLGLYLHSLSTTFIASSLHDSILAHSSL